MRYLRLLFRIARDLPGSTGLVLVALCACALALVCLARARRSLRAVERRLSAAQRGQLGGVERLEPAGAGLWAASLASVAAVPLATLYVSEGGRSLVVRALASAARGEPAPSIPLGPMIGLETALASLPFGLGLCWLPSLVIGSIACACALSAGFVQRAMATGVYPGAAGAALARVHRSGGPPRSWPSVFALTLFLSGGLLLAAVASSAFCLRMLAGVAAQQELSAGDRLSALLVLFASARHALERALGYLPIAIAFSGLIALVAALRSAFAPAFGLGRELLAGAACIALAYALEHATAGYRLENRQPIPVYSDTASGYRTRIALPELEAPDRAVLGPLLELDARPTLDARTIATPNELEAALTQQRSLWSLLHPHDAFAGEWNLMCDRTLATERLAPFVAAASHAGYDQLALVFERKRSFDRPLLGRLERNHLTAARVTLASSDHADPNATLLELGAFARFDDLARAVTALRRNARAVQLRFELVEPERGVTE